MLNIGCFFFLLFLSTLFGSFFLLLLELYFYRAWKDLGPTNANTRMILWESVHACL